MHAKEIHVQRDLFFSMRNTWVKLRVFETKVENNSKKLFFIIDHTPSL